MSNCDSIEEVSHWPALLHQQRLPCYIQNHIISYQFICYHIISDIVTPIFVMLRHLSASYVYFMLVMPVLLLTLLILSSLKKKRKKTNLKKKLKKYTGKTYIGCPRGSRHIGGQI